VNKLHNFVVARKNILIILSSVRNHAGGAILVALLGISEISAALFPKRVQRTIAEQTVEIFPIVGCVAGKIFAFGVAEELVVTLASRFLHKALSISPD
jgi:hypothetical protein